eukprot:TRINITY_DN65657_c0_g1_i1.p1 TRINITY_DN65657_c0_g1~~TRINITY_DN65657_c0_g1_i1.p1  ORF type:complete len:128 (-),score=42.78 TRINITY_DN65657_c0_g1_i1:106-489(-)
MSMVERRGSDFFFFKQKTAYEMLRSLVGSEMCIRDRAARAADLADKTRQSGLDQARRVRAQALAHSRETRARWKHRLTDAVAVEQAMAMRSMRTVHAAQICLLYTSDAADEEDSVDLGGRRIIKKKN